MAMKREYKKMHDRVLGAADIEIDRTPLYLARGAWQIARGYADRNIASNTMIESTKVSMVSDSRRAVFPHCGHFTLWKFFERASGLSPVGLKSTSVGNSTGRSCFRNRHFAALCAINDRDGCAPIALAREQPIAQMPELTVRLPSFSLQAHRRSLPGIFRCDPFHSPEFTMMPGSIYAASSLFAICRRAAAMTNFISHTVLLAKREIARLVRGHAHDRAGTVVGRAHNRRSRSGSFRRSKDAAA